MKVAGCDEGQDLIMFLKQPRKLLASPKEAKLKELLDLYRMRIFDLDFSIHQ